MKLNKNHNRWTKHLAGLVISSLVLGAQAVASVEQDHVDELLAQRSTSEIKAYKLFERLVGVPLSPRDPKLRRMTSLIEKGDLLKAAETALKDDRFYGVKLRNFAARFTNVTESPNTVFNDLEALIIGLTRDDEDFRKVLTGDLRYEGYSNLGLPAVSRKSNAHYQQFEAQGFNYWNDLTRVNGQWDDWTDAAGALTTRAWAAAHYDAGTNRRAVQYSFDVFLCTKIEKLRDRSAPGHFIRRDVDRAPDNNPSTFQTHCKLCHAQMDAVGGAFAKYDFVDQELVTFGPGMVAPKFNINSDVYPDGRVTVDDSWTNLTTSNPTLDLGWRGATKGKGVQAYAEMLANSKAFSKCMSKRVAQEVCRRPVEASFVDNAAEYFEASGYQLKSLFAHVSITKGCLHK